MYIEETMTTTLQIVRTTKDAVLPTKAGPDEIGYDLTLTRIHRRLDDYTIMYDTDIIVKPPNGFYVEVVPRSSIVKTGWFMANSIGIIDPTYRDTIKVVLKRVDLTSPEIELPRKLCQLILRNIDAQNVSIEEVETLDQTTRHGGFGSTDMHTLHHAS